MPCRYAKNGSDVLIDDNDKLTGVSINSSKNKSLTQLTEGISHNKVGVTTVGSNWTVSADVIASSTKNNPNHATSSGISVEQAEVLMTPTQKKHQLNKYSNLKEIVNAQKNWNIRLWIESNKTTLW